MPLYLCLDQGGHASRALVLDGRGTVAARAVREVATQYPAADYVEQDAEEVVATLIDAAHEAVLALGPRAQEIAAVALATQRSSIVCWDRETGKPLSPLISWQDRRAHAWLGQFAAHANEIEQRTGLKLSAHYGASKLRWCLEHLVPVQVARDEKRLVMGPLASFLAFRLLEQRPFVVDPSNAQRTLLWNLVLGGWDPWLLELFNIPEDALPVCVPTRHASGTMHVAGCALPATIITGDQAAALFALGAPGSDTAYVNIGTGAFIQRVVQTPQRVNGLLSGIVLQDGASATYTLEGTVNGAGSALTWASQIFAITDLDAQLSEWLSSDTEPPLFLNGVGGLGAPYWIADFVSRFVGTGDPWQKVVALVESIVFQLAVNLECMQSAGTALRALVVTGGLAQHDGLCQRLADVSNLPVWRPDEHEATARGLAWLLAECPTEWCQPSGACFSPTANAALRQRYDRWRTQMDSAVR